MTPVMSALIGLLAGVASLLALMWVVLRVQRSRYRAGEHETIEELELFEPWWMPTQPFKTLRVSDAFDPELSMIWDSQADALGFIRDGGSRGVLTHQLALVHRMAAARNPELYDGSGFEEWLLFMEECDLVTRKADRVFITAAGSEFVAKCLLRHGGVGQRAA